MCNKHSGHEANPICERTFFSGMEEVHWHDEHEIVYLHSGHLKVRMLDGIYVYDVYPGEIAVFRSCDLHHINTIGTEAEMTILKYSSTYTALIVVQSFHSSFVIPASTLSDKQFTGINLPELFENLCKEAETDKKYKNKVLLSGISLLSLLLSRMYHHRRKISSHDFEVESTTDSGFFPYKPETMDKFGRITEYIKENFSNRCITLDELSLKFGLNRTHISELFPKLAGSGFRDYLAVLRINKALRLLCTTNMNISEIAYASGFETIRSFNNVFKEKLRMTPSAFLKTLKEKPDKSVQVINPGTSPDCVSGFYSNVSLKAEPFSIAEISKSGYCQSVICNDFSKIIYTTLSTHNVFHAGAKYKASFYFKPSESVPEFTLILNFHYSENGAPTQSHIIRTTVINTYGEWRYCEAELSVEKTYIPTVKDRITLFANPVNEMGVDFSVADLKIVCVEQ